MISKELVADGWLVEDHSMIGQRVIRTVDENTIPAIVVAWLPSTVVDPFLDDDGVAVPLFKIRYVGGELDGDLEDLELCELMESLDDESPDLSEERNYAECTKSSVPKKARDRPRNVDHPDESKNKCDNHPQYNLSNKAFVARKSIEEGKLEAEDSEDEVDDDDDYVEESTFKVKKSRSRKPKTHNLRNISGESRNKRNSSAIVPVDEENDETFGVPIDRSESNMHRKTQKKLVIQQDVSKRRRRLNILERSHEWSVGHFASVTATVNVRQKEYPRILPPAVASPLVEGAPYWLDCKNETPELIMPTGIVLSKQKSCIIGKSKMLNCGNPALAAELDLNSSLLIVAIAPSAVIEVCTEEQAANAVVEHLPSDFLELAGQFYTLHRKDSRSDSSIKYRAHAKYKGALAVWRVGGELHASNVAELAYRIVLDFVPLDVRIGEGHGHTAVLGDQGTVYVYGALPSYSVDSVITVAPAVVYKPQHCCISCLRWSPHDPKLLVCGLNDGGAVAYIVPDAKAMVWIEGARCHDHHAPAGRAVRSLCFDLTDPAILILANDSGWIQIWRFLEDFNFAALERRSQQITLVSSIQCLPNSRGVVTASLSSSQVLGFNLHTSKTEILWRHAYTRDAVYDLDVAPILCSAKPGRQQKWDLLLASSGADGTVKLARFVTNSNFAPLSTTLLVIRPPNDYTEHDQPSKSISWCSPHSEKLHAAVNTALYDARTGLKRLYEQLEANDHRSPPLSKCHILLDEGAAQWNVAPGIGDDPDTIIFAPKRVAVRSVRFAHRSIVSGQDAHITANSICLVSASHCGLVSLLLVEPEKFS
mmetsp:Transcript_17095/g.25765  ORF Transcript_17095/g.25765 Transcript_17095/m.25765 type:complete len:820 (+) Transcript_17095:4653-7112(+)